MPDPEPPPTPPAEPPEKTLPAEAVAAATAAIEEAQAKAAAADFPEREQILASLLETKGTLNELRDEIKRLGEVREKDLSDKQLFAVQLANRSIAGEFLAFLDSCIDGTLKIPEGIGGPGEEPGAGGGEAGKEEEPGGEAAEGGEDSAGSSGS